MKISSLYLPGLFGSQTVFLFKQYVTAPIKLLIDPSFVCLQFGNRLDDLLELVCSDVVANTVEEVEEALQVLQEKTDACGE